MNDLIALLVVAAALAGTVVFHVREAAAWRAERSRLLDRIMARNYNEYAYTATTATTAETPQMTSDEAEAAWAIAHASDADAAWHEENRRAHPELYPDEAA